MQQAQYFIESAFKRKKRSPVHWRAFTFILLNVSTPDLASRRNAHSNRNR
jgi:hypothetical protein